MKFTLKMLALLLIVINISLPDSFQDLNFFASDTVATLYELSDKNTEKEDINPEDDKSEIEHLETELYLKNDNLSLFLSSRPFRITIPLHTFIASFFPSIYIPPLL